MSWKLLHKRVKTSLLRLQSNLMHILCIVQTQFSRYFLDSWKGNHIIFIIYAGLVSPVIVLFIYLICSLHPSNIHRVVIIEFNAMFGRTATVIVYSLADQVLVLMMIQPQAKRFYIFVLICFFGL